MWARPLRSRGSGKGSVETRDSWGLSLRCGGSEGGRQGLGVGVEQVGAHLAPREVGELDTAVKQLAVRGSWGARHVACAHARVPGRALHDDLLDREVDVWQ